MQLGQEMELVIQLHITDASLRTAFIESLVQQPYRVSPGQISQAGRGSGIQPFVVATVSVTFHIDRLGWVKTNSSTNRSLVSKSGILHTSLQININFQV